MEGKKVRLAARLFIGLKELLYHALSVTVGKFLGSSCKFTPKYMLRLKKKAFLFHFDIVVDAFCLSLWHGRGTIPRARLKEFSSLWSLTLAISVL